MYNKKPVIHRSIQNKHVYTSKQVKKRAFFFKCEKITRAENVLDVFSRRGGVPSQHSKQIRSDHLHLSLLNNSQTLAIQIFRGNKIKAEKRGFYMYVETRAFVVQRGVQETCLFGSGPNSKSGLGLAAGLSRDLSVFFFFLFLFYFFIHLLFLIFLTFCLDTVYFVETENLLLKVL